MVLVHRIIVHQPVFVAREATHVGVGDICRRKGFRPYTHLHHVAVERLLALQPATEHQRCRLVLQEPTSVVIIGDILRSGIELNGALVKIIDHDDACEVRGGQRLHRFGEELTGLAIRIRKQLEPIIRREDEGNRVLIVTVGKEGHLPMGLSGFDEHIDGQVGDGQFTQGLAGRVVSVVAVEIERGGLRDTGSIGDAKNLEVIILVEPVTGYRFAEPQFDIVLQRQDAVGWQCLTEQHRRTGVLDTADDGRSLGDKARTVAAERYGTQVVVEFLRVTLAIEAERRDSSVLYLRFVTRSEGVETVVGEERAGIDPRIVVLRGELVLELNMVEVLMMDIKAINGNRQIIADRIPRREGIHHPFIPRIGNADGRRLRHEMNGELRERTDRRTGSGSQFDRQILIVVHDAALHLHGLDDRYARFAEEGERRSRGKRLAVHEDDGSVGVRLRLYGQR